VRVTLFFNKFIIDLVLNIPSLDSCSQTSVTLNLSSEQEIDIKHNSGFIQVIREVQHKFHLSEHYLTKFFTGEMNFQLNFINFESLKSNKVHKNCISSIKYVRNRYIKQFI
jgi:hypothetical protein